MLKINYIIFNDESVHEKCLKKYPLGQKAIDFREKAINYVETSMYCMVGGNLITNPDNLISTVVLSSDENDPISEYNFLTIDSDNLVKWEKREIFLNLLKSYQNSGKWESLEPLNYLDYLINRLTI